MSEQLVFGEAHHLAEGVVGGDNRVVEVRADHRGHVVLESQTEALFVGTQLSHVLVVFSHVSSVDDDALDIIVVEPVG